MAIAGATVAAAASVGAVMLVTGSAQPASGVAFAHYASHLDASQRSASAPPDEFLRAEQLATRATPERAYHHAVKVELARAAARRAAARAAAARRAAARLAAARSTQATSAPAAPSGSPQQIAAGMLSSFGWSSGEFGCLDSLWGHESGWSVTASNPSSGAYGIPQALPGSKMASAGPDWQANAATQIRWGLGYIKSTYGSPCAAWSHEESAGWY